jgi:nicotinamidase-related amidase
MSERALIVIDVQNDYFAGGAWALPDAERALPNILKLVELARERGEPVVFIQHVTPEGSPVFAKGSPGCELHGQLEPRPEDHHFTKSHPSAFQETGLLDALEQHGIAALDICGFMTQMCCDTTSREGYQRGYQMRLFSDATAAKAMEVEGAAIPHDTVHRVSLGALARFAQILKTEEA